MPSLVNNLDRQPGLLELLVYCVLTHGIWARGFQDDETSFWATVNSLLHPADLHNGYIWLWYLWDPATVAVLLRSNKQVNIVLLYDLDEDALLSLDCSKVFHCKFHFFLIIFLIFTIYYFFQGYFQLFMEDSKWRIGPNCLLSLSEHVCVIIFKFLCNHLISWIELFSSIL